jgi:hypothetical protein
MMFIEVYHCIYTKCKYLMDYDNPQFSYITQDYDNPQFSYITQDGTKLLDNICTAGEFNIS